MTTSKFKQHFSRHLADGDDNNITHRGRYERALDDLWVLPSKDAKRILSYSCARFRHVFQAMNSRLDKIEVRLSSIEDLLREVKVKSSHPIAKVLFQVPLMTSKEAPQRMRKKRDVVSDERRRGVCGRRIGCD
ncbi:hypothetical protein GN958_ATG06764 [Phytophthora infestans]|uniref:Uncharacterized protein n=1 Tax=Phytophthora infestans TaxID=4787 RepID=A0A8S9USQ8_PHYIN|nr:hypothetical protein GN958_ATG06764 [Phytophthora infestans]